MKRNTDTLHRPYAKLCAVYVAGSEKIEDVGAAHVAFTAGSAPPPKELIGFVVVNVLVPSLLMIKPLLLTTKLMLELVINVGGAINCTEATHELVETNGEAREIVFGMNKFPENANGKVTESEYCFGFCGDPYEIMAVYGRELSSPEKFNSQSVKSYVVEVFVGKTNDTSGLPSVISYVVFVKIVAYDVSYTAIPPPSDVFENVCGNDPPKGKCQFDNSYTFPPSHVVEAVILLWFKNVVSRVSVAWGESVIKYQTGDELCVIVEVVFHVISPYEAVLETVPIVSAKEKLTAPKMPKKRPRINKTVLPCFIISFSPTLSLRTKALAKNYGEVFGDSSACPRYETKASRGRT
jgi:hypothetical protein